MSGVLRHLDRLVVGGLFLIAIVVVLGLRVGASGEGGTSSPAAETAPGLIGPGLQGVGAGAPKLFLRTLDEQPVVLAGSGVAQGERAPQPPSRGR